MTTNVIMPALGMAQETGKLIRWLVEPGATVKKGDLLMEVETDKATVEIEATGSGVLTNVTAAAGDEIPVGQVIAVIVAPGESAVVAPAPTAAPAPAAASGQPASAAPPASPLASPLAARIAAENGVDLRLVIPKSGRVEKADVLAFIEAQRQAGRRAGRSGPRLSKGKAARVRAGALTRGTSPAPAPREPCRPPTSLQWPGLRRHQVRLPSPRHLPHLKPPLPSSPSARSGGSWPSA